MNKFQERYPEYKSDWAWYMGVANEAHVSILVDLKAKELEGREKLPLRLSLTIPVARFDEEGNPTEDKELVDNFSDYLEQEIKERYLALHVSAMTFANQVHLHYYLAGDISIQEELCKLISGWAEQYQLTCETIVCEEADWSLYDEFAYPDSYEMACIQNQRIFLALEEHGDKLEKERPVEYFALFESEEQAKSCGEALSAAGYQVVSINAPEEEDNVYSLMFIKEQNLEVLNQFNNEYWELMDLVDEHEGYLDGWGTPMAE